MNAVLLGCLRSISSDPAQVCVCGNRGIICWQDGQPSSKNRRCRQRPFERRLRTCNFISKPYIWTRTSNLGYVEQVHYSYLCFLKLYNHNIPFAVWPRPRSWSRETIENWCSSSFRLTSPCIYCIALGHRENPSALFIRPVYVPSRRSSSIRHWRFLQGVLINTKRSLRLINFSFDDTYFQYTTVSLVLWLCQPTSNLRQTGWMMWTFMLTGLACGSRLVLYDGSPFHPDVKAYLKFVSDQGWVL